MDVRAAAEVPLAMHNAIMGYDWGSTTALAQLQGRVPSGRPEAELWMGTHAAGPSLLQYPSGDSETLADAIAADPESLLGERCLSEFGPRLPYLFKILAIDRPLSVQVHPDAARAAEAFATGGLAGHVYSDAYPKPELLYALAPVEALCGFRTVDFTRNLLSLMAGSRVEALASATTQLDLFTRLITWPQNDRAALAAEFAQNIHALLGPVGYALSAQARVALHWVGELCRLHPVDPLVVAPLVLELVHLEPGESLYVPAGTPHAYLRGLGVEIMGNSDNVLRAGLTAKQISVAELLHTLDPDSTPVVDLEEVPLAEHEVALRPPAREFQVVRARLTSATPVALADLDGPQIALCTSGRVELSTPQGELTLSAGQSAFVGAAAGSLRARAVDGPGEIFRAGIAEG